MEGVSRCVGRLEVAGAHFPAEDARAVSEAADAAGVVGSASDGPDEQVEALARIVDVGGARLRVAKISVSEREGPGSLHCNGPGGLFNFDLFLEALRAPAVRDHLKALSVSDVAAVGGDIEGMLAVLRHVRALEHVTLKDQERVHFFDDDKCHGATLGYAVATLVQHSTALREIELEHLKISSSFGGDLAVAIAERVGGGVLKTLRVGPTRNDNEFAQSLHRIDLAAFTTLELSFSGLVGGALHPVAPQLVGTAAGNLSALRLERTELGDTSKSALGAILRGCTALRRLTLVHFDAWATIKDELAAGLTLQLETLVIRDCERENEALEVAAQLLARSKGLLEFEFTFQEPSDAFITQSRREEHVLALAKAIQSSPCLRRLVIDYEPRDVAAFARAIVRSPSLSDVDLRLASFATPDMDMDEGAWETPKMLHNLLSRNTGLEQLTVELRSRGMGNQIAQGLEGNNTLRVLQVDGIYTQTPNGGYPLFNWIVRLSNALASNRSLKVLVLRNMKIGKFGDFNASGMALGEMLAHNEGLEVLRIECMQEYKRYKFDDKVAQSLAKGLRVNRTLRWLRMGGWVTVRGLRALRDGLTGRSGTFTLELARCHQWALPDAEAVKELRHTGAHVALIETTKL